MAKQPKSRKLACACYDHLGGILGELFFYHFREKNWIRPDFLGEYEITHIGWNELEAFGLEMDKFNSTRRKIANPCIERHCGEIYKHNGSLLGALLVKRLLQLGWLEPGDDREFNITDAGFQSLRRMGIKIYPELQIEGELDE